MKIPAKIIKFLDSRKIRYETINHKTVYTAYDKAATLKVKPNVAGKTLVLKVSPSAGSGQAAGLVLVLIPGNKNLDLVKIKKAVKAKKLDFVSETIIKNKFKGIKLGAIPPFGEVYKLPLFVDRGLAKPARNASHSDAGGEKNIFVSSGIYESSFKISPKIFASPGRPREKLGATLGNFSKAKPHK